MHLQMHKRHQIGNIIVSCAADIDVDGDSYELPQWCWCWWWCHHNHRHHHHDDGDIDGDSYELPQHKQDASQEIVATIDLGTLWLGRGELNNQGFGKIIFTEMSEADNNHMMKW